MSTASPAITLRPGRRLVAGAALAIAAATPGFVVPGWGWLVAAAALVLTVAAVRDGRSAATAVSAVRVRRRLPAVVGRGLEFTSAVVVETDGTLPPVVIRDVHPADCIPEWSETSLEAGSGSRAERGVPCRIPRRGRHQFGPAWIRVAGPLGLVEAQRAVACPGTIEVLPETFASRDELIKETGAAILLLDRTLRSRELGAGTEFVSLLPFRDGDDPRRIDWRATARHRAPVVRRFQIEKHRDVIIALDRGRLMGAATDTGTKLDGTVDSALNLARVVLRGGDRCGLVSFDDRIHGYLPPVAGPRALSRVVETAAPLSCGYRETDFQVLFAEFQRRVTKRCLVVVLTDFGDLEASRPQVAALARLARRHLVLVAAVRTPLLRREIHTPAADLAAGARQAVAFGLLRDRGRALAALAGDGIHVVDVEPGQLTLPLINRFVELRGRNLL